MKIIVIRGLSKSGKTTIAHKLEDSIKNSFVIHSDDFNIKNLDQDERVLEYQKILRKIDAIGNKYDLIVIEGIIYDKYFFDLLKKISCKKVFFKLRRKEEKEDKELEKKLNNPDIKGEHILKNNNIPQTIKNILDIIS